MASTVKGLFYTEHRPGGSSYFIQGPDPASLSISPVQTPARSHSHPGSMIGRATGHATNDEIPLKEIRRNSKEVDTLNEELPSPTTAADTLDRWNHPRSHLVRTLSTFWAFLVMGANDAAIGVCISYPHNWSSY